jgi:methionine-rich copper-binding protein CopC
MARACLIAASLLMSAHFLVPRAAAHAVIVESTPAVNAVVDGGTVAITLRYNSRIDHERSRLTLIAADGKARTLPIAADSAPDIVAAEAIGLTPGTYRLRWQVLAVDGHLTRGDIPFSVKAP